jgi:hypothetical protein
VIGPSYPGLYQQTGGRAGGQNYTITWNQNPEVLLQQQWIGDDPEIQKPTGGTNSIIGGTGEFRATSDNRRSTMAPGGISNTIDNRPATVTAEEAHKPMSQQNKTASSLSQLLAAADKLKEHTKIAFDPTGLILPMGVGAAMGGIQSVIRGRQQKRLEAMLQKHREGMAEIQAQGQQPAEAAPAALPEEDHTQLLSKHVQSLHEAVLRQRVEAELSRSGQIEGAGPYNMAFNPEASKGTSVEEYKPSAREMVSGVLGDPGLRPAIKLAPLIAGLAFPNARKIRGALSGLSLASDLRPMLPSAITGPSAKFKDWAGRVRQERIAPHFENYANSVNELQGRFGGGKPTVPAPEAPSGR